MSLAVTYYAGMEWLFGIFTWLGAFAALLTIGEILDRWLREGSKSQTGNVSHRAGNGE
jgi:hypothetical protein